MTGRYPDETERALRRRRFPLGAAIELHALDADPYPILATLRESEPVTWVDCLGMWYVTRHADVRAILLDARLGNDSAHSPVRDTFGSQMLSSDGAAHLRQRGAAQPSFAPAVLRQRLEPAVRVATRTLVESLRPAGAAEMRATFARRLPVLAALILCGLDGRHEASLRRWYDVFGEALENFAQDGPVRERAAAAVAELHALLRHGLASRCDGPSLLSDLAAGRDGARLDDEEIIRNLSIILFGGISTVEALILTTLWALATHPTVFDAVRADPALIPAAIEEAIRWRGPVQSATRHVHEDGVSYHGVEFRRGEVVNAMLGSANRDAAVFQDPDHYRIGRSNIGQHLGFATGVHACLGFRVARLEATIALEELLTGLEGFAVDTARSGAPRGFEFHQPLELHAAWGAG
jgi:cytochrome P450